LTFAAIWFIFNVSVTLLLLPASPSPSTTPSPLLMVSPLLTVAVVAVLLVALSDAPAALAPLPPLKRDLSKSAAAAAAA
jgi:hypothetical protein